MKHGVFIMCFPGGLYRSEIIEHFIDFLTAIDEVSIPDTYHYCLIGEALLFIRVKAVWVNLMKH